MEDFRHLRVYQHSRELTRGVWRATRGLPWQAQKLVIQLDEACESIGANIAEGCGGKNRLHGHAELMRYAHKMKLPANGKSAKPAATKAGVS